MTNLYDNSPVLESDREKRILTLLRRTWPAFQAYSDKDLLDAYEIACKTDAAPSIYAAMERTLTAHRPP